MTATQYRGGGSNFAPAFTRGFQSKIRFMNTQLEAFPGEIAAQSIHKYSDRQRRILLVDDDIALLGLNAAVLIGSGHEVDIAADGTTAWKALHDVSYDLVITDNQMPEATGLELILKLRSESMTMPVILASGTMPIEELKRNPWLEITAILPKPFTIAELLDIVEKTLKTPDGITYSAQLFRDCALADDIIRRALKPARAPIRDRVGRPHRILVVDDNKDTRQVSVDALTGSGYRVEGAKDGAAGWKALQANSYDLIVTDNSMPNMTGVEMIGKMRSARMAVPVIMATGTLPLQEFARKPWLTPDAMMQRPFSTGDLLATVSDVLGAGDGNEGGTKAVLPQYP
jgi:DNA-binding response OmpR family regulator